MRLFKASKILCPIFFVILATFFFVPSITANTCVTEQQKRDRLSSNIELRSNLRSASYKRLSDVNNLRLFQNLMLQSDLKTSIDMNKASEPGDLAETEDVQITEEIRRLAVDELKSDPLKIFLYVYNEIGYIPYGWSLQGSAMTLSTRYGNDYDQSSLLIALYRAAGIPARYMQAYVVMTPERLANLVGAEDDIMPYWICLLSNMLASPETEEGSLKHYYVLHCWVKAYIDGGWVDLDPSFKEFRYYKKIDFSDVLDPIMLNYPDFVGPEEILKISKQVKNAFYSKIESLPDDTKIKSIIGGQVIIKVDDYVAPPEPIHPPKESSSLGDTDRYPIAFMFPASDPTKPFGFSQDTFFIYNTSTTAIAGKRITISFTPASEEDYTTINTYGGILFTPCEYFFVKPVLLIDGEPVLVGDPMRPGEVFPYTIISYYPYFSSNRVDEDWNLYWVKETIAGSYTAISLNLAKVPLDYVERIHRLRDKLDQDTILLDELLGESLYGRAMVFWYELEKYASILALEFDSVTIFEAPGIVLSGIEVRKKNINNRDFLRFTNSLMDIHVATDFLPKTTVHPENVIQEGGGEYAQEDPKAVSAQFLYGLFGAKWESYVFYHLYNSPPASALQLFILAGKLGIPIHIINSGNFDEKIGLLEYDEQTKSTLRQFFKEYFEDEKIVIIPERRLKNQILTIKVSTQEGDYAHKRYQTFDVVGYLTIDKKGRFGSHTLVKYFGGFSGVLENYPILDAHDPFSYDYSNDYKTNAQTIYFSESGWLPLCDYAKAEMESYAEELPRDWFERFTRVMLESDIPELKPETTTTLFRRLNTEQNQFFEVNAPGKTLVPKKKQVSQNTIKTSSYTPIKLIDKADIGSDSVTNTRLNIVNQQTKTVEAFTTQIETIIQIGDLPKLELKGKTTTISTILSEVLASKAQYGSVLHFNRDPKIVKGADSVMIFSGEVVVKSILTVLGTLNGGRGVDRFVKESFGNAGDLDELVRQAEVTFNAVELSVYDTSRDVRRMILDVDHSTGLPKDWIRQALIRDYEEKGMKKWHAWIISDSGLTVGSFFNGLNEIAVDIPYIYFEESNSSAYFYVWNPSPNEEGETYKLALSNQEDAKNNYYIHVELSGGGETEFYEKSELSSPSGGEIFFPIRITSNPSIGSIDVEIDEPQPSYTIAIKVDSPIINFEPEIFLDDKYLTSVLTGAYKVLAFEEGTEHTISLKPTTIQFENGTQLTLRLSTWEFSERDTKIFQYSTGIPEPLTPTSTSTPVSHIPEIYRSVNQYTPYIGPIVVIFIISAAVLLHRRKRRVEAKVPKKALKYCIACGSKIRVENRYCPRCGKPQE